MGIKIHTLSPEIANQIAAGEVVERPASVVKELLENACDANADRIHIEIGFGGLNRILICDNGTGIDSEDLPMAVAPHATSKIACLDDLFCLHSMGFRGEALASIASVSKLSVESRTAQSEHAYLLQREGAQWQVRPCARGQGTSVDVRDLFYNAPVRKKFLKSERSEFQFIEQVVRRFAFAQPHIALSLNHNAQKVLDLPAAASEAALENRVHKVFGKSFYQHAIAIGEQRAGMRLKGWISGEKYQRSQQDKQWIYVNQRMVRDKLLAHALRQVYEGILYPGRHPACVLYLDISPAEVDVNVHPTKHELRFVQPRLVHDFMVHTLQKALHAQVMQVEEPVPREKSRYYDPGTSKSNASSSLRETLLSDLPKKSSVPVVNIVAGYSLIFYKQNAFLIHHARFFSLVWHWFIQRLPQPLSARPLLVPVSIQLSRKEDETQSIQQLCGLGFEIRLLASDQWSIDSIPLALPQVNLKNFILSYWKMPAMTNTDVIKLLSENMDVHGILSPANHELIIDFLSSHENLLNDGKIQGIHPMDEAACARVFHD